MLNKYEELLEEAAAQNISVDENFPFHGILTVLLFQIGDRDVYKRQGMYHQRHRNTAI